MANAGVRAVQQSLLACAVLVVSWGCRPPPVAAAPGPAECYEAFATAVRTGDADGAWSRLDEGSRARLTAAAREVSKARGLEAPKDGRRLLIESGGRAPVKPKETKVRSVEGKRAVVTVVDVHGEWRDVPMTLEGDAWRVDVASMLPNP